MPARNALPYLGASIESILGQSFGDFELVIRDDGSTDGTTEALRGWAAAGMGGLLRRIRERMVALGLGWAAGMATRLLHLRLPGRRPL